MAYEDYMDYGVGVESEEERRRREEQERLQREAAYGASQDAEDASMGAAMTAMADNTPRGGFMNAVGNYAQRRFDQAVQPFTDPTAALNRRMGMTPEEAANTEVQSTQVKTYGDGSQEEIVKRQIPAGGAGPVNPADMGAVPQAQAQPQPQQKSPEEIARNAQALREMAQGRAAPQAQPTAVPQQLPAQGVIDPNAPMPNIGQVPQPRPGVQVAGGPPGAGVAEAAQAAQAQQPVRPVAPPPTTVTGAPQVGAPAPAPSLAQAGAQAAAAPAPVAQPPAEPAWITAANAAGTDFDKLAEVAVKYPESATAIKQKMFEVLDRSRQAQVAAKLFKDAENGDVKAWNKIQQEMKPERGNKKEEVTTGDYIRAYMYARLGLNDLAASVQAKISGKDTKFGQVQLGNSNWKVEIDAKTGEIVRAQDDEGTPATRDTLNKLAAAGQKFGTQAFSSTGGSQVIPTGQADAGEEYRTVFNSTTGKFENKIITGKNAGNTYTGPAGIDKSVFTQGAKMDYGVISKYREKFGTDKLAALNQARKDGAIKTPQDEIKFLDTWNFMSGVPGYGSPGQPTITPQSSVVTTPPSVPVDPAVVARAQGDVAALQREISRIPANDPKRGERLQILNDELGKAQKAAGMQVTAPPPPSTTPPVTRRSTGAGGVPVRDMDEGETEFDQRKAEFAKRQELERQIEEERRKAIQKPAAEQIAVSADTQNMLNGINKVVKTLDSGKHNIGSALSVVAGRGPVAQAIGQQFETTDAKNTKIILDTVTKLSAEGLKILGSNPSGPDLQFWTANKPDGSSDPAFMKEWIESRSADLKRRLNYAEQQVGTGGRAGTAPPVFPEKTIDGVTYIYDGKGWKKK
jgi:hypothetical protein